MSVSGNQERFTANKDQGIPYVLGRTLVSGWLVHRQTFDVAALGTTDNAFQSLFAVWGGGGPYHALEAFRVDGTKISFGADPVAVSAPTEANGTFHGNMFVQAQLGAVPEGAALKALDVNPYPEGWSAQSKFSGYAGFSWLLRWDPTGKKFPAGIPQPSAVLEGALVYDPRQDSTYPGGWGPCRAGVESTYVWSGVDPAKPAGKNPWLHALTWALGRFQNGKRVLGIGMTLAAIDVGAFAHAANVADANDWTIGGVVYSTDGKLEVLRKMCAAGGGSPLQLGGMLSCEVDAPRVSLATITDDQIVGDAELVATPTISERINGVIPSCRLEDHDWSIVPCEKVSVPLYVSDDGAAKTKAITWELVQDEDQAAELATYAICNSREFGPITTPLKLRWIGYRPGDCLTITSANLSLNGQQVVVRNRHLDPASSTVVLTMRSETPDKHAFSLGQTTTPPPTPSVQVIDPASLLLPGIDAEWDAIYGVNKPEDNATVGAPVGTMVGNKPAQVVAQAIEDFAQTKTDVTGLIATYGQTAAASASAQVAKDARDAASGFATIATDQAQAAGRYSGLSARGAAKNQNPSMMLWPDGQALPTGWQPWSPNPPVGSIVRAPGVNGNPYVAKMVALADQNVGMVQLAIAAGFGSWVVEVTVRADNTSGAGIFIQRLKADGGEYNGGSANRYFSLQYPQKDSSGWPGGTDSSSLNYLRTFSFFFSDPVDGNIIYAHLYAMANWEGFGAPRNAKTIEFHDVRLRPATEAEIAQHDPITGLGSKASHDEVVTVAVDKAGDALTNARDEYNSRFSGVVSTGLSQMIGQRPTYTEVNSSVSTAITTAAGPNGAVAQRIFSTLAATGGNLVPNTGLVTTASWGLANDGNVGGLDYVGLNAAGDDWHPFGENALSLHQVGGDPSQEFHWFSDPISVEQGLLYQGSALLASHRCDHEIHVEHLNDQYQEIAARSYSGRIAMGGGQNGGRNINGWNGPAVNFVAQGSYVRLALKKYGTNPGEGDSYWWAVRPQVVRIPDLSVNRLPFQPGSDRAVSKITQASLADFSGKLASYITLQALAGTSNAEINIIATQSYSRLIFRANQFLFEGDAIFNGSVSIAKFVRADMAATGSDSDGGYAPDGAMDSSGIHPSFFIGLSPCDCTQLSSLDFVLFNVSLVAYPRNGATPIVDGGTSLKITLPDGYVLYQPLYITSPGSAYPAAMKVIIPAGHGVGGITIQAEVRNGNSYFVEGSGTPADPYIEHFSTRNEIVAISMQATWRFIV